MPLPSFLRFLTLLLWMIVMGLLSGPLGSEDSMRSGLTWALSPLSGWFEGGAPGKLLSQETIWVLRKMLHLTEYAILAWLAGRWIGSRGRMSLDAVLAWSLALCAAYAVGDEMHQSFVANRTGSPLDVAFDLFGASLALSAVALTRAERDQVVFRVVDIISAVAGLLLTLPILIAATISVQLHLGSPVLFRQRRLGWQERPFMLLKFRTMQPQAKIGPRLENTERLGPTGRLLRGLSIDEFPQFWNVLRGDMSLVGPRPLLPEYLPYYTPRERIRHLVRPGITGLAQVSGRNALRWNERLELDARYVEAKSLRFDLWIIGQTLLKVLRRSDVLDTAIEGSLVTTRAGQVESKR